MGCEEKAKRVRQLSFFFMLCMVLKGGGCVATTSFDGMVQQQHKNAYATMMYMGTPRDYEFYVAIRVMLRSLSRLGVDADLVVIASVDVPLQWVQTLEREDRAKVVRVENLKNPYEFHGNVKTRFKLTLNKLYAWSLVDYDRVVMLDADNLFLRKTDELFQCGQFCAVFINPCIFHTGLFVLQPSMVVFKHMLHELDIVRKVRDGADQGFLVSYFQDLLDQRMFHPPPNGTKLDGTYRLPLGYQMDASYFYLKLRWNVPCGPNSVITFPSAPWLKPWYWWSWPLLPLGIQWHEQRQQTLGYPEEIPLMILQAIIYLSIIPMSRLARPILSKFKTLFLTQTGLKLLTIWSILGAYIVPCFIIPTTVHPVLGWSVYLLGTFSLCCIAINAFLLPVLAVLVPWLGIFGALMVMAYPWYSDGIVRALALFGYALCFSPALWAALVKIMSCLHTPLDKEGFLPRQGEFAAPSVFNKFY